MLSSIFLFAAVLQVLILCNAYATVHRFRTVLGSKHAADGRRVHYGTPDVDSTVRFLRQNPSGIVVGSSSYFAGFDFDNFGLVVLDRIPKAVPKGYERAFFHRRGQEARYWDRYRHAYLQEAVQALGRLIRSPTAKGTVLLGVSNQNEGDVAALKRKFGLA